MRLIPSTKYSTLLDTVRYFEYAKLHTQNHYFRCIQ